MSEEPKKKPKLKEYSVGVFVKMWVDVPEKAVGMAEAIAQVQSKINDVVSKRIMHPKLTANDWSAKVVGAYDGDFEVNV